ncbi:hypothetical protein AHAS_Ahas13G0461700 [Arachis hypogaea]
MPSRCRITPTITPQSTNPVKPSVTTIGDHRCPPSLCSLSFLFSHFSCRVCCPTPLFALASSGKQHPGAIQQRLNSVLLQYHHCPRSSFSPSSTQVPSLSLSPVLSILFISLFLILVFAYRLSLGSDGPKKFMLKE